MTWSMAVIRSRFHSTAATQDVRIEILLDALDPSYSVSRLRLQVDIGPIEPKFEGPLIVMEPWIFDKY